MSTTLDLPVSTRPAIAPIWIQTDNRGWLRFESPLEVLQADSVAAVLPLLERVESAVGEGLWAAGLLSYEAAPAFDGALTTRAPGALPLAWFGIYEHAEPASLPAAPSLDGRPPDWRPSLDEAAYARHVEAIRQRIARGDTYQVNFTWRLDAPFDSDPWPFFLALVRRDRTRYAAYLDTGEHTICSLSPELFFRLDGSRLTCRPMKGTAGRGRYRAEDTAHAEALRTSAKDRAENVMIVDMVRNDLGRVAAPDSVRTTRLFEVETYPTVHQLTSTVEAESNASVVEILTALFPSASITGAPKIETMKIIRALEERPRGVYTGAIGYLAPERRAQFNVAIRTVHFDRSTGTGEYGTGGGIVWDSEPAGELLEGRTKTRILDGAEPDFELIETLRWSPLEGFYLLDRHLHRLGDSADLLGFDFDEKRLLEVLERLATGLEGPHRVRLRLNRAGAARLEATELADHAAPWTVELASQPIDPENRFLFHKTTRREVYERFRREAPDADDVLLWNPNGELTESTVANLALRLAGSWYTPPVASGLLAGTERAELLETGRIEERVLTLADLDRAEAMALFNSVRGWIAARRARSPAADPRSDPRRPRDPPRAGSARR